MGEIMNYENIALFPKSHAGGDDKLWINLAWPNIDLKRENRHLVYYDEKKSATYMGQQYK